jgi:hypothetical protein
MMMVNIYSKESDVGVKVFLVSICINAKKAAADKSMSDPCE